MGALFQSILGGMGRAGNEANEARTANEQEKQQKLAQQLKMQQFQAQMKELQQRLTQGGVQQKIETAPHVVHTYRASDGKMHNIVRDPLTGKLSDQVTEGSAPEMSGLEQKKADLEKALGRPLTQEETSVLGGLLPKPAATQSEFDKEADKLRADEELRKRNPQMWREMHPPRKSEGGAEFPDKMLKSLADKWSNEGVKPPTKYQAAVEQYMEEHGQKGKIKLTQQEQSVADGIKMVEPMIDRLVDFIEKSSLQDQGAWVFGDHSALMQHLRFYGYKKGVAPEVTSSELIKDAAAIQVQGAKPLMTMGRSKYMYETIVQHLPTPTDTPKLLYDKVTWLRDNVIENAKGSLPQGWEGKGQTQETKTTTQSDQQSPATKGGMPAGATMKVPGSDGKMHWSDGKKDMGVAEE